MSWRDGRGNVGRGWGVGIRVLFILVKLLDFILVGMGRFKKVWFIFLRGDYGVCMWNRM